MEVRFRKLKLEEMERLGTSEGDYPDEVVPGFLKLMRFIRAAMDERDFRTMRSLNFEKLKGDRLHQYSFRINRQWRLVVEIESGDPKNIIHVVDIEDYH